MDDAGSVIQLTRCDRLAYGLNGLYPYCWAGVVGQAGIGGSIWSARIAGKSSNANLLRGIEARDERAHGRERCQRSARLVCLVASTGDKGVGLAGAEMAANLERVRGGNVEGVKLSVVIPYRRRLDNIRPVFQSLAEQTIDPSRFEVIVGAIEYSEEFVRLCQEFTDRLTIITVMSAGEWNVCRARNLAMRQVTGQVIVVLDADMAIPPRLLERLSSEYFTQGRQICVLGRAAGYDDMLSKSDIPSASALPFDHYRELLSELEGNGGVVEDLRDDLEDPPLPWTLVWGGLVALSAALVARHGLTFDEGFTGWGAEDQELGYRIQAAGIPIELAKDIYGLHLPHDRDIAFQDEFSKVNERYFLTKWPTLGVESWLRFTWHEANLIYRDIEEEVTRCAGGSGRMLGVAWGMVGGNEVLVVGAVIDEEHRLIGQEVPAIFDGESPREVLPLAGFALPYDDLQFQECHVMPPAYCLTERYREAVLAEADRVAGRVVQERSGA